ncbi:MAG: WxcM-like domain-containing protein [Saprospiraceae bacterium]|nr:WxcM-like domain-containing protein [Saprospiraceae bacterium]
MNKIPGIKWIEMPLVCEPRGSLVEIEFDMLPFTPRRVFYISNVPIGMERGGHSHIHGKQILFCISGRVMVEVVVGANRQEFICEPNGKGLFIDEGIWARQNYLEKDSTIMVVCSHQFVKDFYQTEIPASGS